jgi:hypothetical protein
MLTGDKLVKVTKILYSQWMKNHDELFESNDVTWNSNFSDDVYKFYNSIHKHLSLPKDVDQFFYYVNTLLMNEENLKNGTLNSSNIITPSKKLFQINVSERRTETHEYTGQLQVDGYFTKDQLESNVYELNNEDYLYLYDYDRDDSELIDSDGEVIEVESVELVKVLKNESSGFNKFLDSLTESEIKFLKEELEKKLL